MRIAGSSTLSVAAAGTALAIAITWSGASRPHIGPSAGPPAAVRLKAPYAVLLHGLTGRAPSVVNMATGKVIATVRMPGSAGGVLWAAAAADDRTFVLAATSPSQVTRFYLLRLAEDGQPGQPAKLRVAPLRLAQIYGLAVTADGTRVAIAWQNQPIGQVRNRIEVVTLATGATRIWSSTAGAALNVSWVGDHLVAFDWQDNGPAARSGIRLLDTSAPGTSPLAARLLIPATLAYHGLTNAGNPVVSPDGSALFAEMDGPPAGSRTAIVRFSAANGRPLAVLGPLASPGGPQFCGVLWVGRTGRHLLTQCGNTQGSVDGDRYTPIRLRIVLPASVIGFANTFAW